MHTLKSIYYVINNKDTRVEESVGSLQKHFFWLAAKQEEGRNILLFISMSWITRYDPPRIGVAKLFWKWSAVQIIIQANEKCFLYLV